MGAAEHIAEHVIGIGEVLHDAAGTGEDRGQASGLGIEALPGDDAVAGGLLGEPQRGGAGVRGSVGEPAGTDDLLGLVEASGGVVDPHRRRARGFLTPREQTCADYGGDGASPRCCLFTFQA